jgi:chaperone required for assembly of F1-ATPase
MSAWKAKRFWTKAEAEPCEGGFTVRLDGRPVKTPAKAALVVPTQAMAQAIAAEWDAQSGEVKPATMPVTRAANSAIDKITAQRDEVVEIIAAYGQSDLLCYRAVAPAALIARQAAGWDPVLDWAEAALGARLVVTAGVVHVAQPSDALARLTARG